MTNMGVEKTDTILSFRRVWILAEGAHMKEGYRKKNVQIVLSVRNKKGGCKGKRTKGRTWGEQ